MILKEKGYRLYEKFKLSPLKHRLLSLLKKTVLCFQAMFIVAGVIPAVFRNGLSKFRGLPKITRLLTLFFFALSLTAALFFWQLAQIRLAEPPHAEPPFDWSAYLPIDTLDPLPEFPAERNRNDLSPEGLAGPEANLTTPVKPASPEPVITKGQWPVRGELFYGFHETIIQQSQGYPIYYTSKGIAILAESGTEAVAPWDGKIIKVATLDKPHGQSVTIEHNNGLVSYHGALKNVMVNVGDQISQGQPFALIGSGVESEPDYLYLELTKDGKTVNPLDYLLP